MAVVEMNTLHFVVVIVDNCCCRLRTYYEVWMLYLDYIVCYVVAVAVAVELEFGLVSEQGCFVESVPFLGSFCRYVFSSLGFVPKVVVEMLVVVNLGMGIDFDSEIDFEVEVEHIVFVNIEIDFECIVIDFVVEDIEDIVFVGYIVFVEGIVFEVVVAAAVVEEKVDVVVVVVANSIDNTDNKGYNLHL